ncbi:hypothetical protein HG537_0B01340 [Torulaspora globosa]|uniref:Pre-mRNA-splicing factor CWC25 n=1 Tax=Torulaspora globosa TaxID=48254 RepID=A0A7H9HR11_9SACH|nr:hypothetical protein HG537_0B01340 [Torulaspora sp. CBS 2947]
MAGSNDLNLLKSWNPKLAKNREKVKRKEEEVLEEEKKIRQAAKERELSDLAAGKSRTGLEWMYDVPKQVERKSLDKKRESEKSTVKSKPKVGGKKKYDDDPMNKFKVAKKRLNRK